jgi:hypothetical protein
MSLFAPKGARPVAPPVYTPEEQAENARRDAQVFKVGDRVVVEAALYDNGNFSDGHGTVVKAVFQAPDHYMAVYFGWLRWLLAKPEPEKRWSYKIAFDGEGELPGGPWYGARSLLPEEKS